VGRRRQVGRQGAGRLAGAWRAEPDSTGDRRVGHFSGFRVDAGLELGLALAEGTQAWLYEGGEDGEVEEEK
jgi:hypothetical protein